MGRLEEASEVLLRLKEYHPTSVHVPIGLAKIAQSRAELELTLSYYREALKLQPNHPTVPRDIASVLRVMGRLEEASEVLLRLKEYHPTSVHVPIGLAKIAQGREELELTLSYYREALKLQPNHPTVPIDIASVLRVMGRLEEASDFLNEQLQANPGAASLWNQKGQIDLAKDEVESAITNFEQGIKAEPDHGACYVSLLNLLIKMGSFSSVEKLLNQADLNLKEKLPLEMARISSLKAQGFYDQALEFATSIYSNNPNNFSLSKTLADLFIRCGKREQSLDCINKIQPMNEAQRHSLLLLKAEVELMAYDIQSAKHFIRSALEIQPNMVSGHRLLTKCELMEGDAQAAKSSLKSAESIMTKSKLERVRKAAKGGLLFQLWREFSLNPYADTRLREARDLPAEEKLKFISDILKDEPNHAGSAINFLVTLRQLGRFTRVNGLVSITSMIKIPRTIFQFWDTLSVPEEISNIMKSWDAIGKEFKHVIFSDETALAFLENECSPKVAKAFRMANHPAMRSDLFRLAYLYVNGGVYADADDLCRSSIESWLCEGSSLVLLQEDFGSIGNNFIAAAPRHPFIRAALDQVVENILEKQGDCIWFISGPGALTTLFCQFYLDDLRQRRLPSGIVIRDVYQMRQKISMHLPRAYKHDIRGWSSPKAVGMPLFKR